MGRGLSDVQKSILRVGWRNYLYEHRWTPNGQEWLPDVLPNEVLHEHYKWPLAREGAFRHTWGIHEGDRKGGQRPFSKHRIGEQRYASGRAALSRAAKRLAVRGLIVEVHGSSGYGYNGWVGYGLTEAGLSLARSLWPGEVKSLKVLPYGPEAYDR